MRRAFVTWWMCVALFLVGAAAAGVELSVACTFTRASAEPPCGEKSLDGPPMVWPTAGVPEFAQIAASPTLPLL